jgi:hypothetical protein
MSEKANVFINSGLFIPGNTVIDFRFSHILDDAYWDLKIVTRGTNNEVELLRQRVTADAAGTRRLIYTVRNNTGNGAFFTRGAVRIPPV